MTEIIPWHDVSEGFEPWDGAIITGVPDRIYHQLPGTNKSALDAIEHSPFRYRHRGEIPESDAMKLGTLDHLMLLQPELLEEYYFIVPSDTVKNPKHEKYQKILAEAGEKVIVKEKEVEAARQLVSRLRENVVFCQYLDAGDCDRYVELSVWFTIKERLCKLRADLLIVPRALDQPMTCFDLKTCRDSTFAAVQLNGEKYRNWPKGAAFYGDGLELAFGRPCDFGILAAENAPPFEPNLHIYRVGGVVTDLIKLGRRKYFADLDRLEQCELHDYWPTAVPTAQEMSLSHYAYKELNDD